MSVYEHRGEGRIIALPRVLATAGLDYPIPGVVSVELTALAFTVTATGGGGARQVVVQLQDSTGATVYGVAAPGTQASGQTVEYSFAPGVVAFGSGALGFMGGPLPAGRLPENLDVVVQVVSAGGADTLFNARILWRQFALEPTEALPLV